MGEDCLMVRDYRVWLVARTYATADVQDLVLSLGDPLESDGADAGFLNASRSSESSVRLIHDI